MRSAGARARSVRSAAWTAALVLVAAAACDVTEPGPVGPERPQHDGGAAEAEERATHAFVSDPVDPSFLSLASGPAGAAPIESAAGWVYVSLAPGSVPDASVVAIRNGAGPADTLRLAQGGFDPVRVAADVGDTLHFAFSHDDAPVVEWSEVVAPREHPDVVRTYPSRGKRDVPLRSLPLVVFSEPMGSGTLSPTSIRLIESRGAEDEGVPVPGVSRFQDAEQLVAEFVPAEPLKESTGYALIVTRMGADLDGDLLQREERVQFTTGGPGAPAALEFLRHHGVPTHTIAGYRFGHPIAVVVVDEQGNEVPTYAEEIELSFAWNPTGAALHGATPESIRPGYDTWGPMGHAAAYFDRVRIDDPGRGYQLEATAPGLTPAVSLPFDVVAPGELIAFSSPFGISVASADGHAVGRFPGSAANVSAIAPSWAPDGSRVVYGWAAFGLGGRRAAPTDPMVVIDPLTGGSSTIGAGTTPAWSPDGREVAFITGADSPEVWGSWHSSDIYIRELGTGAVRWLARGGPPAWAPDGETLVFARDSAVFRVRADGTGLERLADARAGSRPAFAPDGSRIAFGCVSWGLCVMQADGTGITEVPLEASFLAEFGCVLDPAWSPDGTRIAFNAQCSDGSPAAIGVVRLGSPDVRLVAGRIPPAPAPGLAFGVFWPSWRPQP